MSTPYIIVITLILLWMVGFYFLSLGEYVHLLLVSAIVFVTYQMLKERYQEEKDTRKNKY